MVKLKTGNLQIFTGGRRRWLAWILPALSVLTFIFSWAALYPTRIVEHNYARAVFPQISHLAGRFADLIRFSWLDVTIPVAAVLLALLVWQRRWVLLLNITCGLYFLFFWTWGINYHRQPLDTKLQIDRSRTQPEAMTQFAMHAVSEVNRLFVAKQNHPYDDAATRVEAARRVRKVVGIIDGTDWACADRLKVSRIGGIWFRAAGIDGVFNPFPQEPVINSTVLDIERPFVMTHELAHVRGYPDERDANVIAALATLMSDDPNFQYSGWLNLWLYLRTRELDKLLDPGPRQDIQRIFDRARREQVRWINDFQQVLLDMFLKANSVDEGVRSYSRVVLVAAATEPSWERFR